MEPVWHNAALLGEEREAGAQSCRWRDQAEASIDGSFVKQDRLQQQESKMETRQESPSLTEDSFVF